MESLPLFDFPDLYPFSRRLIQVHFVMAIIISREYILVCVLSLQSSLLRTRELAMIQAKYHFNILSLFSL